MVSQSDIIIITAGAKVDNQKKIDYTDAVNTCKQVASALHSGMLVVYCNVAGFGFNEVTLKETIENTSGLKIGQDSRFSLCSDAKSKAIGQLRS